MYVINNMAGSSSSRPSIRVKAVSSDDGTTEQAKTVKLPSSTNDSSGSSSSSTPVPIDEPVPIVRIVPPPTTNKRARPSTAPQTQDRVLRSKVAAVPVQAPDLSQITDEVSLPDLSQITDDMSSPDLSQITEGNNRQLKSKTQGKQPAPKGQKPNAKSQAGPSVAPAPQNRKARAVQPTAPQAGPSVAPPPLNRTAMAVQPTAPQAGPSVAPPPAAFKIDPDTICLLSALDSYHDFTSSRSELDKVMVGTLIKSFIHSNPVVENEFKDFTNPNAKNKKTLEQRVYEKYVLKNNTVLKKPKIQLNKGGAIKITARNPSGEDDITNITKEIKQHFSLEDNQPFIIIDDRGSQSGCRDEFNFLISYASWFDRGGCKIDKPDKNVDLTKIAIDKQSLFYIDKIEGTLDAGRFAKGNIYVPDIIQPIPFHEHQNDDDRPEVNKYSTYISDLNNTNFFKKNLSKITDDKNKQMFLMDLKRAGDGLQIVSGENMINGKYAPIFVTSDIIAATISVNKGIRTILTSKDHKRLSGNVHAIKYATMLVPCYLLQKDVLEKLLKESTNSYLKSYKQDQEKEWNDVIADYCKELEKNLRDIRESQNIKHFKTKIDNFYTFISKTEYQYEKIKNQIQSHIALNQSVYPDNDLEETDFVPFNTEFTSFHEKVESKKLEIPTIINGKFIQFFKQSIDTVDNFCQEKNYSVMMKKYLSYITNLIKNPNINDDYDYSLIPKLYDNINNICDAINKKDAFTKKLFNKTVLNQSQITPDIKQLVINIKIAKILYKLFIADEKYKEIMGYDSSTIANNHIKSPIGVIYMEYLLKLKNSEEIKTVIKIIGLLIPLVLEESEANRLIDNTTEKDKYLPTALKNYLSKKTQEVNPTPLRVSNTQFPTEKAALIIKESTYANKLPGYSDLLDFYTRIVHTHNTYMGIQPNLVSKGGGLGKRPRSSEKSIDKKYTSLIRPFVEYKFDTLDNFIKLPFIVKEMIIKLCGAEVKENILRCIFLKYYNSEVYDNLAVKRELRIIQNTNNFLEVRPFVKLVSLRNYSKIHNQNAFKLFKEYIYIYPEYMDPVMMMYMKYSNSPLPVDSLTIEREEVKKLSVKPPITLQPLVKKPKFKTEPNGYLTESE